MKYDKSFVRKKSFLIRKKKYLPADKFNFQIIFRLIKKHFGRKKIIIAGYYPSSYEVNILKLLKIASEYKFNICLPAIRSSNRMDFKSWHYKEPLNINKFGILEPKNSNKKIIPDLILVPLIAYDSKLNRVGYGKGYYDRALKKISKIKKKTIFLGIAFSFQKCLRIPVNKHDIKLDYIFTERGIIN